MSCNGTVQRPMLHTIHATLVSHRMQEQLAGKVELWASVSCCWFVMITDMWKGKFDCFKSISTYTNMPTMCNVLPCKAWQQACSQVGSCNLISLPIYCLMKSPGRAKMELQARLFQNYVVLCWSKCEGRGQKAGQGRAMRLMVKAEQRQTSKTLAFGELIVVVAQHIVSCRCTSREVSWLSNEPPHMRQELTTFIVIWN